MICPSSRAAALGQLDGFISIAGHYARDRNHVKPGHPAVSRLSPAIRHRLITEEEVASTGYLHNHARMWFAAWWVHEARLPWQAGAAFFLRHLLDSTPRPIRCHGAGSPDCKLPEKPFSHAEALLRWAKSMNLQQVAALRPEVGPLYDSLSMLRTTLAREEIRLVLIDRPEDLRIRPFATGGFFPFWERLRKTLAPNTTEGQTLIDFPQ